MERVPSPRARTQRPPRQGKLQRNHLDDCGGELPFGLGDSSPKNQLFQKGLILFLVGLMTVVQAVLIGGIRKLAAQPATPALTHSTVTDFETGQLTLAQVIGAAGGEVQLLPVGVTGQWEQAASLPAPRSQLAVAVISDRLYAIGGLGANFNPTSAVYTASVASDTGVLEPWQTLSQGLPMKLAGHVALSDLSGQFVYVLGGFTHEGFDYPSQDTIYRGAVQPDGNISSWVTETVRLPYAAHYAMGAINNQQLYFLGGQTAQTGGDLLHDAVHRAPIGPDGSIGAFVAEPALPIPLAFAATALYRHPNGQATLFVIGGSSAAGEGNPNVYYADVRPDGTLTSWGIAPVSLPEAFMAMAATQVNDQIVLLGGVGPTQTSGHRAAVISLLLDADAPGYVYDWPDEQPVWRDTFALPAPRYALAAAWADDHIFAIGGADTHALPQAGVFAAPTRGLAVQYVPQGTFSHTLPLPAGSFPQQLVLETAISDTAAVTMTFAFNSDPAQPWATTDGLGQPLVAAGRTVDVLTNTTKITYTLPALVAQQFAYQVVLSSTISSTTPLLHGVELYYVPVGSGQVLFMPFIGSD